MVFFLYIIDMNISYSCGSFQKFVHHTKGYHYIITRPESVPTSYPALHHFHFDYHNNGNWGVSSCEYTYMMERLLIYLSLQQGSTTIDSTRVANITDFSLEVRNLENDPYFSRFLYGVSKFSDILRILQFFYFFNIFYCNWES